MDFPYQNCILPSDRFPLLPSLKRQEYPHEFSCVILDLRKLALEMQRSGVAEFLDQFFVRPELEYLAGITSGKRRLEWLAGRFAARLAAARLLRRQGRPLSWSGLHVMADANGRPFLGPGPMGTVFPDISISHSGDLAAAMAVDKGLCGIDIQRVTSRVVKVHERFCAPAETILLQEFYGDAPGAFMAALTLLWAAKETLRKAANQGPPPGFLALELTRIEQRPDFCDFMFGWNHSDIHGHPVEEPCRVPAALAGEYALALTTRDDTMAANTR